MEESKWSMGKWQLLHLLLSCSTLWLLQCHLLSFLRFLEVFLHLFPFILPFKLTFLSEFMQSVGAAERIFQLLDRVPKIPIEGGIALDKVEGSIRIENVSFSYPSRPEISVLKDVSIELKPGKVVALVGKSGSGKLELNQLTSLHWSWLCENRKINGNTFSILYCSVISNFCQDCESSRKILRSFFWRNSFGWNECKGARSFMAPLQYWIREPGTNSLCLFYQREHCIWLKTQNFGREDHWSCQKSERTRLYNVFWQRWAQISAFFNLEMKLCSF